MAFINKSAKEIQVKVVYYGPGRLRKNYEPSLYQPKDECPIHGEDDIHRHQR